MQPKLSARRLRSLQAAENVARAFRAMVTAPACAPDHQAQQLAMNWCCYWIELTGKHKYELPPPVPARWKHNRNRSMGLED